MKSDTSALSQCVTYDVDMEERKHTISDKLIRSITYISLAAVSAAFVLAFSLWTSPIYKNWYGCDASFFTLVGRGMLDGKVPYRDFYDLKGPYFFFIEALGQLIKKGHVGIYILQSIALFASLVLIYKLGRLYIPHKKALGVIVFFLLAYISLMWGGNCLEEFTLPLNLLAIYLNVKFFLGHAGTKSPEDTTGEDPTEEENHNSGKSRRMYICAAITGLCFTIMTFSKVTAGAPLIGLCIGIFILMMMRKQFREFGFYVLYFILGAFIGFVPLLIYYGYHGCILKMLYCTFIFGFKRSSDLSKIFSWELESKVSGVTFAIVFALLHMFRGKKTTEKPQDGSTDDVDVTQDTTIRDACILLLASSIITYLALHLGDGFIYYFITGMPCMVFALILFVKIDDPLILFRNVKQSLCWLLIFAFVYHYTGPSFNVVKSVINRSDEEFQERYYKNSKDMGTLIPAFDRDKVFSFDIDMQWYEINDIMPCNRYMVNLQYFIALEPGIEQELFDFLENTPPKWMICSNTLPDYLPQMDEIVRSKYDCIYTTDVGLVYLLRE